MTAWAYCPQCPYPPVAPGCPCDTCGRSLEDPDRCRHDLATGHTKYDRQHSRLIYVLVCDSCHEEIRRTMGPEYKPRFEPNPPTEPV